MPKLIDQFEREDANNPDAGYIPYGEEWAKEMMKWTKADLIQQLKQSLQTNRELSEMVGEAAGLIAFSRLRDAVNDGAVDGWKVATLEDAFNPGKFVVFQDGSWKFIPDGQTQEYEDDADHLVTIPVHLPGEELEEYQEKEEIPDESYRAGYDAGLTGPDDQNCSFIHFATPEKRDAWEMGKRDGELYKLDQDNKRKRLKQQPHGGST